MAVTQLQDMSLGVAIFGMQLTGSESGAGIRSNPEKQLSSQIKVTPQSPKREAVRVCSNKGNGGRDKQSYLARRP